MKVIMRHVKHKSIGTIAASASHTMRARPTPNADPNKPAPEVWLGTRSPADDVRAVLPEKRRTNAVLAIEYVVTASPEFFDGPEAEWRSYLHDQQSMLGAYYGQENVVSSVLHLDEKTPHLSIMIVPLVNGTLNARALIGTREACSVIQDLAGEVGKPFGLTRGERGSKARHQDVNRFYAEIQPAANRAASKAKELDMKESALAEKERVLAHQAKALSSESERIAMLAASLTLVEEQRAAVEFAALKEASQASMAVVRGVRPVAATSPSRAPAPR